jgi:hypothetical protein
MKVEKWNTRFGKSVRTVQRDARGRILNHKSAKQMHKVQVRTDPSVISK